MKSARIALFALATVISLTALSGSASAGQYDWLANKDYVRCLALFANGNFMMPRGLNAAQQAAYHEKGRRYCNRTYYGHE